MDVETTSRPHIPSWDDHDEERRQLHERRAQMGIPAEGLRAEKPEVIDPLSDEWLDVVKAPDVAVEDSRPDSIGDLMERLGSLPHFTARFDAGKLAEIDLAKYAYADRTIDQEKSEANLRRMLDTFSQLPALEFNHGQPYFIYGPNGSGKSVLCQAVMVAVQRKRHELEVNTKKFEDDLNSGRTLVSREFKPSFPRTIHGFHNDHDSAEENLIVAISECIEVGDLVTAETKDKVARSEREVASGVYFSLGASASTAMALSGAQATNAYLIDYVSKRSGGRDPEQTMIFLDEPETSRDRHQLKKLKAEVENIRSRCGKETIALVPTHSDTIYKDPTALRIDLDHPEKGIHLPEVNDPVEAIDLGNLTQDQLLRLAELATNKAHELQAE